MSKLFPGILRTLQVALLPAVSLFLPASFAAEFTLSQDLKAHLISQVTLQLQQRYIYPDRGRVAAAELNHRFETGYFEEISDPRIFAFRITGILDVISDLHLWVNYHEQSIPENYNYLEPTAEQRKIQAELIRRRNFGLEKVDRLPGNLGYLEIRDFFYEENESARALANAMELVRFTDGLIIDLRRNGGGHPDMVNLMLSYLLDGKQLVGTFHYREGNRIEEVWTLGEVTGPHYTENRPVYLLLSENSFSAAEGFSYTLQARNRAVLVGERTRGGAHPFENIRLHEHYMMAVPIARSVDPITGSNWQYIGIRPEHEVPADEAMVVAQRLLLEELIAGKPDTVARREQEAVLRRLAN